MNDKEKVLTDLLPMHALSRHTALPDGEEGMLDDLDVTPAAHFGNLGSEFGNEAAFWKKGTFKM